MTAYKPKKKYKMMKIPMPVFLKFKQKQDSMQRVASEITGKNIKIPMIRIVEKISDLKFPLEDSELLNMRRKKKHVKKKRSG